jgi:hypothetical protein
MKAESFFIGPYDEDIQVDLTMSLSELKYVHGILVDCFNQDLDNGINSRQMERIITRINSVITNKLEAEEKKT